MSGWTTYRVVSDLRGLIRRGEALAGGRLPSERELAEQFGVSRGTVRSALALMRDAGELETRSGRDGGTFVSHKNPSWILYSQIGVSLGSHELIDHPIATPQGTLQSIAAQGDFAQTKVISLKREVADEEAQAALELEEGNFVYTLVRLRYSNGSPIALEQAQLPVELFPDLPRHNVADSLYSILRSRYNVRFSSITDSIEMACATDEQAKTLHVPKGYPLFLAVNTAYDAAGRPVEHSRDYFRSDAVRFVTTKQFDIPENVGSDSEKQEMQLVRM